MNISLTGDDFKALVRGEVVEKRDPFVVSSVRVALQDLGWDWMEGEIQTARGEARRARREGVASDD